MPLWHDPTSNRVLEHRLPQEWHQWIPQPVQHQQQHYRHLGLDLDPPLLALQRVSVTVSCVWLVITSVGTAPVAVPPEAHLTLYSRLESLPWSTHWAVQHASVADDGLHLSQAIRSGQAVLVSDASLHGTSSTFSTVVEGSGPEHRLLCHAQVPGPIKDGDSLHCKLVGNYSAVLCVNAICLQHNVTQGSITVARDCLLYTSPSPRD